MNPQARLAPGRQPHRAEALDHSGFKHYQPAARAVTNRAGGQGIALTQATAQADDQVAEITRHIDDALSETKQQLAGLEEGLKAFCEQNRAALTDNGRSKTAKFATGRVQWRARPPKVSIRGMKDVIARIRALGMTEFLRERIEINKDAMLEVPEKASAIEGVSIGSAGEDFVIEPLEVNAA